MTHDPLCLADPATDNSRCHYCVLIAKVREDERAKHQGQSVMLASDAEAAIAAAEQRERQVVIIGQETHDAVKELCREAWQQGERAMLAKAIAAVEYLHDHEAPHDAHKDALWNAITALRALQEKQ